MIEARGQLIRVSFPDDNHARLYDLGKRIEDGEPIEPRELQQVFKTWRGFAQDDPNGGAPFTSWHDIPDFALDMLHSSEDAAAGAAALERCGLLRRSRGACPVRRALPCARRALGASNKATGAVAAVNKGTEATAIIVI
jgi:hypothetical protein